MGDKTLMRPVLITAGVLGAVQGLLWTILSIVSILFYQRVLDINEKDKTLGLNINASIYYIYTNPDPDELTRYLKDLEIKNPIIANKNFNIFMYFYLTLSFVWFLNSAILLWENLRDKLKNYEVQVLAAWIVTNCLSSILDLVLMSLIAHDYDQLGHDDNFVQIPQAHKTIILASMGIVMTLAARGYVIWIINVIFAVILAKYCRRCNTQDARPQQSIIDAFGNSTRPPFELQNSLYDNGNSSNFDYTNKSFQNDNEEPIYTSNSFHRLQVDPRDPRMDETRDPRSPTSPPNPSATQQESVTPPNQNNLRNSNVNNFRNSPLSRFSFGPEAPAPMEWKAPQVKTAKIGRQGQKSPPLQIAPPFIPAPDYSPSNSLRVKGVLRPKSNYMYE